VCPNKDNELVCLASSDPQTGCKSSTACTPCAIPHATVKCDPATGKCVIGQCQVPWADCNGDATDGCETNVEGDPTHCGDCSTNCIATLGPNWICDAGQCVVNDCVPPTTLDCDKDKANGCEVDSLSDPNNCLFCGNKCDLANAIGTCAAQKCIVVSCKPGYQNCDGVDANGCETKVDSDPGNCGACGTVCDATNGVPGCAGSVCGIVCNSGFGNCDGNPANGCEVTFASDPSHCGGCGQLCTPQNGTAACTGGACSYGTCSGTFADCDGNSTNGCETNTQSDPSHCGACSNACTAPANATAKCTGGACSFDCNPGFATCGGASCVDILNDPANCGAGCVACGGPPSGNGDPACQNGACTATCHNGYTNCTGDCFDLQTDKAHCGSCTTPCNDTPTAYKHCVNGVCTIQSCKGSLTQCGQQCVNTNNNPNHCGGCGIKCGLGKTCVNGTCQCTGGKMDCGNGICVNCCGDGDCQSPPNVKCCLGVCLPVCT
jgi:hypothetical protein